MNSIKKLWEEFYATIPEGQNTHALCCTYYAGVAATLRELENIGISTPSGWYDELLEFAINLARDRK